MLNFELWIINFECLIVDLRGSLKQENAIVTKSFDFAIKVVDIYKYLCEEKREFVISKQLLRCGTSIGANVNEAQAGQSRADFISKMSIASKEARETKYWIDLLIATSYLNIEDKHIQSLRSDIDEIIKMLTSIVKTSKKNVEF